MYVPVTFERNVGGRYEEAEKALRRIAKHNGNDPKQVNIDEIMILDKIDTGGTTGGDETVENSQVYTIRDLFTNGNRMVYVLFVSVMAWSAANVIYYGIALNTASLPLSVYWSNVVYAAAELPIPFVGSYMVDVHGKLGPILHMLTNKQPC